MAKALSDRKQPRRHRFNFGKHFGEERRDGESLRNKSVRDCMIHADADQSRQEGTVAEVEMRDALRCGRRQGAQKRHGGCRERRAVVALEAAGSVDAAQSRADAFERLEVGGERSGSGSCGRHAFTHERHCGDDGVARCDESSSSRLRRALGVRCCCIGCDARETPSRRLQKRKIVSVARKGREYVFAASRIVLLIIVLVGHAGAAAVEDERVRYEIAAAGCVSAERARRQRVIEQLLVARKLAQSFYDVKSSQ